MFRTIVALVSAPLFFAVAKKKTARVQRAERPAPRSRQRQDKVKAKGKPFASVSASKRIAGQRVEAPENGTGASEPVPPPAAPVRAPALFSPPHGEFAESLTPSFRWFYVGSASHYELVWSLDSHFHKAHILLTNQTAASLPPEQSLVPGTAYVWRVRGGNEGGWGPWSATRTFTTPEV